MTDSSTLPRASSSRPSDPDTMRAADSDPLSLLRLSITQSRPPILSHTPDPPEAASPVNLASASYLIFSSSAAFPMSTRTRFYKTSGEAVDLRSIYFAWLHREDTIPDYITKAQNLGDGVVTNLAFLERLELVTWLEGGQEESDFIKPLTAINYASASGGGMSGGAGGMAAGGFQGTPGGSRMGGSIPSSAVLVGKVRQTDPRLLEIYSHERVLSNRNTFLRGIKPTDFSHVRKQAEDFITRLRNQKPPTIASATIHHHHPSLPAKSLPHRSGHPSAPSTSSGIPQSSPAKSHAKSRSRDPIILLSSSPSSLLSMANIKPFLESGTFTPANSIPGPHPQIHHISRLLPNVHPTLPIRFIVVDSPEKFKPEYWDRVVGVFTTGQAWQFRGYKWSNPVDLFREVRGFYVGWDGEKVPETVRGWGAGVRCLNIERARRFRDREVCEQIWDGIEVGMKSRGFWSGRA